MEDLDKLAAIYAALPTIQCKQLCQSYCGPIGMTPVECQSIRTSGHPLPSISPLTHHGALTCSALSPRGKCRIYNQRPLICRLFGLVKALRCPHGCQPSRWLTDTEADAIKDAILQLKPGPLYFSAQELNDSPFALPRQP